jgi:hypothetical protein
MAFGIMKASTCMARLSHISCCKQGKRSHIRVRVHSPAESLREATLEMSMSACAICVCVSVCLCVCVSVCLCVWGRISERDAAMHARITQPNRPCANHRTQPTCVRLADARDVCRHRAFSSFRGREQAPRSRFAVAGCGSRVQELRFGFGFRGNRLGVARFRFGLRILGHVDV